MTCPAPDLTTAGRYTRDGHPWAAFDRLRREAPAFWYHRPGFEPFWAITRHADIVAISQRPEIFSNTQRLRIADLDTVDRENDRRAARTGCPFDAPSNMLAMDPPAHRANRRIASLQFTPRAVAKHEEVFRRLSEHYAEDLLRVLTDADGPVDFVRAFADRLPLFAICSIAGVPEEDWPRVLRWIGARVDPGHYPIPGLTPAEIHRVNLREFDDYFLALIADRRRTPREDLLSSLVHRTVDGVQLTDRELLEYLLFLISAGNETTRSTTAFGLEAVLQHPDQLQLLVDDPGLLPSAVEEIVRWTSVFGHFARTCRERFALHGREIRPGETVALFYPSANRDETVFTDPYTFDVTRNPNPHVGFGRGEHFCLGVNLAKAELRAMFGALIPQLPRLALAGPVERIPGRIDVLMARALPVRLA
ncbi:cytochrome P450 [Amycolatopsis jejuensis]|uniref:cytochrome P450 n=1 Tax=Amycolatopsis jejuensis TaxID=330084 RepID=UPI000690FD03|nr:cytochrome P450 [Amycolatopsis jejuensis]